MITPGASVREWDVFISYSRADADKVSALVSALQARDLRVFVDDTAVDDFASITATITEALAHSRILLALYSADYPQRRACQWELTYAYLTGQREGDPRRRTLVLNPEPASDHVHPVELRDARHWPWPTTPEGLDRLAARVADHVGTVTTFMGDAADTPVVPWLPAPARTGSFRFTGRLPEQWRLHTALHRHRAPLVAQTGGGRGAQLRGMPGLGKSLLAQEYALHFSSAFPGGVFWFDLHPYEGQPAEAMRSYAEQVSTVLAALRVTASTPSLPGLLSHLAVALGERNLPCLWVVDGVPDGLTADQLALLRGPHLLTATLITTRSLRYTAFAECLDMAPLSDADGYHLLTSRRVPDDELEHAAALALVRDVGGHPEALDLLADLAATGSFVDVRNRLHAHGPDVLATRRPVPGTSAPARRPLATALLPRPLSGADPADDVLRLLALACPAPLSQTALENVLSSIGPYDPWDVGALVSEAVEALRGSGALRHEPLRDRSWTVHPLLARAVQRHDTNVARQEDLRRVLLHALIPDISPQVSVPDRPATTSPVNAGLASAASVGTRPSPLERAAAFDLQVELVTRVGVQPLPRDHGSLREALTSLHSLFATTRELLHRVAAETAVPLTLPAIAARLTNTHLRPFLTTWHPALQEHEATRPPDVSPVEHERNWKRAPDMRADLAELRGPLVSVAEELAALCGVDLLTPSSPPE
ncbi:toll/interleukin-1 receptor domain-containing protein [Streptomyces sp. 15-116A]|uniref:toll/interleukin-1 receptor domain-containing protein n=1 Tax=Streptomyces sp. 15-116A TaxID=2259035 RepID=UPI0021B43E88|nr:toll/interleukin-1 receptor domain-containing protein [Streptomyces sp. 15-116A]MCT7351275.1 toll/interleukin-1 receptor domain-containing protein [Streptomyces sp. 15-116A]